MGRIGDELPAPAGAARGSPGATGVVGQTMARHHLRLSGRTARLHASPSQLLAVVFDTFNDIEKRKFKSLLLHKRTAIQHAYRLLVSRRVGRSGPGRGWASVLLPLPRAAPNRQGWLSQSSSPAAGESAGALGTHSCWASESLPRGVSIWVLGVPVPLHTYPPPRGLPASPSGSLKA